jgi:hypothetical protein
MAARQQAAAPTRLAAPLLRPPPRRDLAAPFHRQASHPKALEMRQHALSPAETVAVALQRQMLLLRRDVTVLRSNLVMVGAARLAAACLAAACLCLPRCLPRTSQSPSPVPGTLLLPAEPPAPAFAR